MSDFESEEMGWRYWVDAMTMTTSSTDHREGVVTKDSCPGDICVGQYFELFGTSMPGIMSTGCLNVPRSRLSTWWIISPSKLRVGGFGCGFSTACKLVLYLSMTSNCSFCVCERLDDPYGFST